jgi:diguanylate cyclase (GGDEF)-like protein/putative nucleotidyltransferase with HDIG domain
MELRRPHVHTSRQRPTLLLAVYGGFLLLVGTLAVVLALLVTAHFSAAAIDTTVSHDRSLVWLWANANLEPDDLDPARVSDERLRRLDAQLTTIVESSEILHVEVRTPGGFVLVGTNGSRGMPARLGDAFLAAAEGRASAELLADGPVAEAVGWTSDRPMLREYLPITSRAGTTAAVVGIWRDAAPILARVDAMRAQILIATAIGSIVVAVLLLLIFRAAQRRLTSQARALVETMRRDPLTGLLNHGAIVAGLAARIETARAARAPLGIALIDIDGFQPLNDLHGHSAGDAVLVKVSTGLGDVAPTGTLVGRYGPDEFLVVGPPMATELVHEIALRLRDALAGEAVQFPGSEPLPISVSVGLASYPGDAEAVTDLLMVANLALGEAKASGGGAIRRAVPQPDAPAVSTGFGVLQGLVLAIDTKDRYTKRHSEDVARYALFLGRRLGLPDEELELLRVGGLLHDVGKVGIPDALLRKPGRLTADEVEIFKHHVVIGDLIVRDLPNLEEVRAGVRYHHERWDGRGYLAGLAGDEIPLVGRVLAVADAFSAMTTTRPYRKAFGVGEALKRLGDAAGTQLEERLVREFIAGMEVAPDAPLPGDEVVRRELWTPQVRTA